jgi:hypothetical protein
VLARFEAGEVPVFLISLKAGGTGHTSTRRPSATSASRSSSSRSSLAEAASAAWSSFSRMGEAQRALYESIRLAMHARVREAIAAKGWERSRELREHQHPAPLGDQRLEELLQPFELGRGGLGRVVSTSRSA